MQLHQFEAAVQAGEVTEAILDAYYSQRYQISTVSPERQLQGCDRLFVNSKGDRAYVEYKLERRGATTGNLFAELWHCNALGKLWAGWCFKSRADYLALFVPSGESSGDCYWVPMKALKPMLHRWAVRYRPVTIQNEGKTWRYTEKFETTGILVPLREIEAIALRVDRVSETVATS